MKTDKTIYGVGINDANYFTRIRESLGDSSGKRKLVWSCPYYSTWKDMIKRCYSEKYKDLYPTYIGCSVVKEWHLFSNFKDWMEHQRWEGRQLDKDLLVIGNKTYSPETCTFVCNVVNSFVTERDASRGEYPIGVSYSSSGKFRSYCNNPFTRKQEHLGLFNCPQQAHKAWLKRKLELAKLLAAEQDDPRVAKALVERYENYQNLLDNQP